MDPSGRDSIFVARPLSGTEYAQHGFVITTRTDRNGRQVLRERFSFGPVENGEGDDPLRNVTNTRDATDVADAKFTEDVLNNINDGTALPDAVFTAKIDAPENVVEIIGNATLGNVDYETVPNLQPGPGANSNFAAVFIADAATRFAGGTEFTTPDGSNLPGSGAADHIEFDRGQLRSGFTRCRQENAC